MVLFRRSTGRQRHLVPTSVSPLFDVVLLCCAVGGLLWHVIWVWLLVCDPRESEQLCRTDFEFLCKTPLHRAFKRHPSLSLSVQARRVCCEVGDGSFWHGVTALTSRLTCAECSKCLMVMWACGMDENGGMYSFEFVSDAARSLLVRL